MAEMTEVAALRAKVAELETQVAARDAEIAQMKGEVKVEPDEVKVEPEVEVTIESLHTLWKYEVFEDNDGHKALTVMWDAKNEKMSDFMRNEISFGDNPCAKRSLMWIEDFKEICDYEQGQELFLYTKQNADFFEIASTSSQSACFRSHLSLM